MSRLSIKSILIYAGVLTVFGIASFLLFTEITGRMIYNAELIVNRYDINIYNVKNDCPLSKEEEKRLGFVTLTTDDLNKVPKLKEAIDFVERGLEEATREGYRLYTDPDTGETIRYYYWIKDENGCYNDNWHYFGLLGEQPVIAPSGVATLTQSEYNSLRELIYDAYEVQYTQELKRLAELYKELGLFGTLIKYDGKYYKVSMRIGVR